MQITSERIYEKWISRNNWVFQTLTTYHNFILNEGKVSETNPAHQFRVLSNWFGCEKLNFQIYLKLYLFKKYFK